MDNIVLQYSLILQDNIAFCWPVASHEVIANSIAATTTTPGLTIQAELDTGSYPTSVKIPDAHITELSASGTLNRHTWRPEWNTFKTSDRVPVLYRKTRSSR